MNGTKSKRVDGGSSKAVKGIIKTDLKATGKDDIVLEEKDDDKTKARTPTPTPAPTTPDTTTPDPTWTPQQDAAKSAYPILAKIGLVVGVTILPSTLINLTLICSPVLITAFVVYQLQVCESLSIHDTPPSPGVPIKHLVPSFSVRSFAYCFNFDKSVHVDKNTSTNPSLFKPFAVTSHSYALLPQTRCEVLAAGSMLPAVVAAIVYPAGPILVVLGTLSMITLAMFVPLVWLLLWLTIVALALADGSDFFWSYALIALPATIANFFMIGEFLILH